MLTDEAKEFLEKNYINEYKLNSDGTVDVDGDVTIIVCNGTFPVKFGKVNGGFDCSNNNLTSLVGCPSHVSCSFYCRDNKLTSLEGAPIYIGGEFSCSANKLTSLHNIHKHLKYLKTLFYCYDNTIEDSALGLLLIKGLKKVLLTNYEVQEILNKYIGQGRAGVIDAQQELLDAGLDEYAKL